MTEKSHITLEYKTTAFKTTTINTMEYNGIRAHCLELRSLALLARN